MFDENFIRRTTVGAVLVKGGKLHGRGRTAPAAEPHAEIAADIVRELDRI